MSAVIPVREQKTQVVMRHRRRLKLLAIAAVICGLSVGQTAPAMASSFWNLYYNGYTTQGVLKSGVAGMISGGKAQLVLGNHSSVYIRTYGPNGSWVAQQKGVETDKPVTLSHAIVFDGTSKCMWTGDSGSRSLQCQAKRNT